MKRERFDVAVVGGGPAGIAAATTAAGEGARTLLIDDGPALGGNVSNALVHTICGLYQPAGEGPPTAVNPGLPWRVAQALARRGGAGAVERAGRVHVLPIVPAEFARLAAELCRARPRLSVRSGTALVAIELCTGERSESRLALAGPAGGEELDAAVVIDTSGDGSAAALGGADFELAPAAARQACSFIFGLAGVEAAAFEGFGRLKITRQIAGASRGGPLPRECESVLVRPGERSDRAWLTLTLPVEWAGDALDPEQRVRRDTGARELASALASHLRQTRGEFKHSRIVTWPARSGVRETRRVCGQLRLTGRDVIEGRQHDAEVALSSWPIELWDDHRGARFEYPQAPCSIPLGALVSRSHPRLGMAGRCLSASHRAHGALRVIGTALATGEAIGVAAALAADRGVGLMSVTPATIRDRIAALVGEPCVPQ